MDTIITLAETPPTITYTTFQTIPTNIPIIVPCGTSEAYSNAAYWNVFTNIQEPEDCDGGTEGVEGMEMMNEKVYYSNGQIVVEGAEGNMVWLYDVNGRILATKRDDNMPLRFDVPSTGTYMIKIGNHTARKVVVVR